MKLKILYAASNNSGSKIQLERFINCLDKDRYQIKIAAYRKSSPNMNIDWSLDCLLNIFKPDHVSLDNDNFETYYQQVKSYNPDLIISDLEYFTSYIANLLNITLWQCSPSLLNFALTKEQKYNLGLYKQFYYLFHKIPLNNQRVLNMIDNSNYNFVYSHLGDATNLQLKDNFEWIRPYHIKGQESIICQHNIIAATLIPSKNIIGLLKRYTDTVLFAEDCNEQYTDILLKEIKDQVEYTCNLYNCNLFMCGGQTSFLADAYYNKKFSLNMPDYNDTECVINSVASEHFGLSKTIYDVSDNIAKYYSKLIETNFNDNIKLLHERLP